MPQRFLFAWRNALASEEGPRHALDRHVAMVLSLYMNGDGLGAWPSGITLAARTGVAVRTVRPALKRLCEAGWLARQARKGPKGIRAPRWGFEYRAALPRRLSNALANEAAVALFNGKEPFKIQPPVNGAKRDKRMGHRLPTNSSIELVKNNAFNKKKESQAAEAAEIASYEAAFAGLDAHLSVTGARS